jgi:hypothetical protein
MSDPTGRLAKVLRACKQSPNPLNKFNDVVLRRPPLWFMQREICRAVWDPSVTTVAVKAGHSVGKSYVAADVILGWGTLLKNSLSVSTSPSNTQLDLVLWGEIRKARAGSDLLRNVGRLTKLPNKLDLGDGNGWQAIGYSTNKSERMQGLHGSGGPHLNVVDEASGITSPDIWAVLKSLKARKNLYISNPLYDHGHFYETCRRAEDDPRVRLITIPSTMSPDIHLEESLRGLADAGWLREMAADYGEDSQTYRVRVLAEFPSGSADALVPKAWLDRAGSAKHEHRGRRRLAVDVAEGHGGDDAVLVVRDDNGILEFQAGNRWDFQAQATRAALLCQKWGIDPGDVTYDAGGPGADFANRLEAVGLHGCRPYRGGRLAKSPRYFNLRSACHWQMRRRLNPATTDELGRPLTPFHIPPEFLTRLRGELREITYSTLDKGRIAARDAEEVKAALRHSPDYSAALAISFMSNN